MLASTPPDFGSPDTTAFVSLVVGCFTTAYAILRRDSKADVMWAGFVGTFFGCSYVKPSPQFAAPAFLS